MALFGAGGKQPAQIDVLSRKTLGGKNEGATWKSR
jgi:hypothetical protein